MEDLIQYVKWLAIIVATYLANFLKGLVLKKLILLKLFVFLITK